MVTFPLAFEFELLKTYVSVRFLVVLALFSRDVCRLCPSKSKENEAHRPKELS